MRNKGIPPPLHLWKPKANYSVQTSSPVVPCPGTQEPSSYHPTLFFNINFNIVLDHVAVQQYTELCSSHAQFVYLPGHRLI
jgi:hypothetical protein